MEFLKGLDLVLQTAVVRWANLLLLVLMIIIATVQTGRLKANELLLDAAQGQVASYTSLAKIAEQQRIELEKRAKDAKIELEETKRTYEERIKKLKKTPFKAQGCDGMVKESVRILQEKTP